MVGGWSRAKESIQRGCKQEGGPGLGGRVGSPKSQRTVLAVQEKESVLRSRARICSSFLVKIKNQERDPETISDA